MMCVIQCRNCMDLIHAAEFVSEDISSIDVKSIKNVHFEANLVAPNIKIFTCKGCKQTLGTLDTKQGGTARVLKQRAFVNQMKYIKVMQKPQNQLEDVEGFACYVSHLLGGEYQQLAVRSECLSGEHLVSLRRKFQAFLAKMRQTNGAEEGIHHVQS